MLGTTTGDVQITESIDESKGLLTMFRKSGRVVKHLNRGGTKLFTEGVPLCRF